MNELELKANAMLSELSAQRNAAWERCAILAGELALLRGKVGALEEELKKLTPKAEAPQ